MVSNQTDEEREGPYFTAFFLILNGKVISVIQDTTNEIYHLPFYKIRSIFSLNGEKSPRLIVEKYYFNNMGTESIMMYQLEGKKLNIVVEEKNNLN